MYAPFQGLLAQRLADVRASGLYKQERLIDSAQGSRVRLKDGREALNLCANNYLGLANHPQVKAAAAAALERWGYGLGSVRFICGTQTIHRELEAAISDFLGTEDTILYSSCWDANGGLFETILGPEDAVLSDALNHASIIDGIRLCKAQRLRYANCDLADLEAKLVEAKGARVKLIATDGVFSMDGTIAPLAAICDLADRHGAVVMMDDSHGVGFLGKTGRGTHEHRGCQGRVDIITGTLGKALGGASGGYTSGRKEVIDILRQQSRTYLFSNSVAPVIVATTLAILKLLRASTELRDQLMANAAYWRRRAPHARRRRVGAEVRRGPARARRLRGRLLLSRGRPGQGAYPHPTVGRAHPRRAGRGAGGLRRGQARLRPLTLLALAGRRPTVGRMDPSRRDLEERIAFLQRHVEQQDRVLLELSREVAKLVDRLARLEAKTAQAADAAESGPPADERPPHW